MRDHHGGAILEMGDRPGIRQPAAATIRDSRPMTRRLFDESVALTIFGQVACRESRLCQGRRSRVLGLCLRAGLVAAPGTFRRFARFGPWTRPPGA